MLLCALIVLTSLSYCARPDVGAINLSRAPDAGSSVPATKASSPIASPVFSELSSARYVRSPELNVRLKPKGAVVSTLKRATRVEVYETRGKWARISAAGQPEQWVSEPNLCAVSGCADSPDPAQLASSFHSARATVEPIRYRSDASECPCSGGNNCIGPRGGRYCITSGGNKRYR